MRRCTTTSHQKWWRQACRRSSQHANSRCARAVCIFVHYSSVLCKPLKWCRQACKRSWQLANSRCAYAVLCVCLSIPSHCSEVVLMMEAGPQKVSAICQQQVRLCCECIFVYYSSTFQASDMVEAGLQKVVATRQQLVCLGILLLSA